MSEVKLFAPGDSPVLLATTQGGHTFSVSPNGTPVPKQFHKAALAAGCVPEEMRGALKETAESTELTRVEIIEKAIDAVMAEVEAQPDLTPKFLTGDGRPDASELSRRVGFAVKAAERDEAFELWQHGGDD